MIKGLVDDFMLIGLFLLIFIRGLTVPFQAVEWSRAMTKPVVTVQSAGEFLGLRRALTGCFLPIVALIPHCGSKVEGTHYYSPSLSLSLSPSLSLF